MQILNGGLQDWTWDSVRLFHHNVGRNDDDDDNNNNNNNNNSLLIIVYYCYITP